MAARPPLRIGGQISSATGVARGRIGGFATNPDGRLFALVPRHVAYAEADGDVYDDDNQKIGTAIEIPVVQDCWDAKLPSLAAAIAAVDVTDADRPIVVQEAGIDIVTYFENPMDALDRRVRMLADPDECATGSVTWVGSRVRVLFADDRCIRYTDAVEITFERPEQVVLARGDAGMPIVGLDGRLVGLVISGVPARCFVAPAAPFLKRHGLKLYAQKASTAEFVEPLSFDKVAAGLRDASLNLSEWMRETTRPSKLFTRTADGGSTLILEGIE